MKAVLQRVIKASVIIDDKEQGRIGPGLLIYICFENHDNLETIDILVNKIVNLRVFSDSENKMNLNILQHSKEVLSVSQFTLSWDGKKGNRPSFDKSMPPNEAKLFYRKFNDKLIELGITNLQKGQFGAEMKIKSENDGPVTFFLDF